MTDIDSTPKNLHLEPPAGVTIPSLKKNQMYLEMDDAWLIIKKIDLQMYSGRSAQELLTSKMLERAALEQQEAMGMYQQAEQGYNALHGDMDGPMPQEEIEALTLEAQKGGAIAFERQQRQLVKHGVVWPKFADLLEQYGGSEDELDYGMGSDFSTIADAVFSLTAHSAKQVIPSEDRFSGHVGAAIASVVQRVRNRSMDNTQQMEPRAAAV